MMFFYQIFIRLFVIGIRIHSLFNEKSAAGIRGRRVGLSIPVKKAKRVWVHCASLGEYEQAKPVIGGLANEGVEVVLTFFSPSGYEHATGAENVVWMGYMPFDTRGRASSFVEKVDPDAVIFVKYEFWWNHISEIIRREIPLYLVSVVLREEHYIFRNWASTFLGLLKRVDGIYAIDESTELRLKVRGFTNVVASADTRIESVLRRKKEEHQDATIQKFVGEDPVIIFGSTYDEEHKEIIRISDEFVGEYKIMIFAHVIEMKELIALKESIGKYCMLYSELAAHGFLTDYRVLIVDRIGLLKDAYRNATLAYIGGGLTTGLHNTLEPFVYKIPLIFGHKYEKFPEARLLAKQRFTRVLNDVKELPTAMREILSGEFTGDIDEIYSRIFERTDEASVRIVEDVKYRLWKKHE